MSLRDLATQEMVIVCKPWLDPEQQRPLLERLPRVAPLLDDIATVHANIVIFQNAGKQESAELAELRAQTSRLDAEHDRLTRAIHYLLLGLVEMSDDAGGTAKLEALRAELLPQGLGLNQQSYLVQAGEVELRRQRLSAESKQLLASTAVRMPGCSEVSLRELVDRWERVAKELGEVEAKKVRMKAGDISEGSRGPARQAWIRVVSHFLKTLDLEKGLTEAERRELLQPLRDAEAKAAKKRALAKKKNVPFDPDAAEEVLS